MFSKKNIACASTEQKETLKKTGRRAGIDDTPSSSESEQPAAKKGKAKKRGKAKTPDVAFDFDKKAYPPSVIDISSNTTVNETASKENEKECKNDESAPKAISNSEKVAIPVKATASWQVERRASES